MQLTLEFKYGKNRYLEIKNNRAYDDETLLSQVGGFIGIQIVSKNYKDFFKESLHSFAKYRIIFIGIFLGFSLLQVAQVLFRGVLSARKYLEKNQRIYPQYDQESLQVNTFLVVTDVRT